MFAAKTFFFIIALFSLMQPVLALERKWKITLGVLGVTVFPTIFILCVLDMIDICRPKKKNRKFEEITI
jgi:hypothetical protein